MTRLCDISVPDDVVGRACDGDSRAQAQLYELLSPAVFGLIRRLVGSRAVAEDLFQETMMTVFGHLHVLRNRDALGAWVRQIAVSRALMYLRSPWHRARLSLTPDTDEETGLPELSDTVSAPLAERYDLERALASLSPTARAVVWLYEVEGYTHEEIARAFGRSISFSKSQLARAHRRLREWFEPGSTRQPCTPI